MKRVFETTELIKVKAELDSYLDSLAPGKTYALEIKEHRKRRSLDANAYAWVMLDKLSAALGMQRTELYRSYIREIGGVSDTVCVAEEAADDLCEHWEAKGLGWQTERMKSKIPGCVNVVLFCGSSVYDVPQMARLIDLIVQDCKELGIETKDPAELEALLDEWR